MIRPRSRIAVALPVVLFLGHHLAQLLFDVDWPLLNGYLDPLCFLPVLFTCWLWELSRLFDVYRLSGIFAIVASVVLAIFVEEVFPAFGTGFTHDWLDYPMYFLGLAYFWWFINPEEEGGAAGAKEGIKSGGS